MQVNVVKNTDHMFFNFGCSSTEMTTMPDISGWDVHSLENAQDMFDGFGCDSEKLLFRLDLSKWNLSSTGIMQMERVRYIQQTAGHLQLQVNNVIMCMS